MNEDFRDLLAVLLREQVRFLVVGAHALAVHGVVRATGDLDVWIARDPDNATRAWRSLLEFGAPVEALGVLERDLATPGMVVQIGQPPRRIDVLTEVSGIDFASAWSSRVVHRVGDLDIPFLGRGALLTNKRASGRLRDLADVEALEGEAEPQNLRPTPKWTPETK